MVARSVKLNFCIDVSKPEKNRNLYSLSVAGDFNSLQLHRETSNTMPSVCGFMTE